MLELSIIGVTAGILEKLIRTHPEHAYLIAERNDLLGACASTGVLLVAHWLVWRQHNPRRSDTR
jgi:uncharacterized membrane protein